MPCRRRDTSLFAAVLCAVMAAWAAEPAAAQRTGGMPAETAPAPAPTAPGEAPPAAPAAAPGEPAAAPPPAIAGGLAYGTPGQPHLLARAVTMLGRTLHVRGTLPGAAGARVMVQRLDPRRGWLDEASAPVRPSGRFLARWRTDAAGRFTLRAVLVAGGERVRASAAPVTQVTVYRAALATWYGPGFFGRQTACGQTMTPELVGVAHQTLGCGKLVEVAYAGRTIVLPVVDRGPFNPGVAWDLTQAAATALGFTGREQIGYIRASAAPAA